MSLDFSLVKIVEEEIASVNITHNVSPMWREAGIYDALYNSEGKKAEDVYSIIEVGFKKMLLEPDRFRALNPANGWGSYESSITWLYDLLAELRENPDTIIRISK